MLSTLLCLAQCYTRLTILQMFFFVTAIDINKYFYLLQDDGIMDHALDGDGAINLSTSQRPSASTTPSTGPDCESYDQVRFIFWRAKKFEIAQFPNRCVHDYDINVCEMQILFLCNIKG